MTNEDAKKLLTSILSEIAPEIDLDVVDKDANLQDELDLDSVDFLNLVEGIYEASGVDVPEADYSKLASVNTTIAYLANRTS
jgi:acyl carrier protein